MTAGFVKIYASITRSSVWLESNETRLVWITMLVAAGPDGVVEASVGGLAHLARVTKAECRAALDVLEAPDADSRSEEHDGRRVEKVDGGWLVLNHAKYRERQSDRNAKAADRQRRWRERKRDAALRDISETHVTPSSHQKSEVRSQSAQRRTRRCGDRLPPPKHRDFKPTNPVSSSRAHPTASKTMDDLREAVANNRRIWGMPPQPMHETHDWNELALEAVKLAIAAVNTVLTEAGDIHQAADKLQQAAALMGHAATKRNPSDAEPPSPPPTP